MDIFALLPSVLSGIIAITLLHNAEKEDEYIAKFWSLIFGFIFVWATIFFLELGIEFTSKTKNTYSEPNTEYYNVYY